MEDKPKKTLRLWRMEQEVNLTTFAKKIKVSPAALSLWETGQRTPTYRQAKKLADALDISVDEVYAAVEASKEKYQGQKTKEPPDEPASYRALAACAFSF